MGIPAFSYTKHSHSKSIDYNFYRLLNGVVTSLNSITSGLQIDCVLTF